MKLKDVPIYFDVTDTDLEVRDYFFEVTKSNQKDGFIQCWLFSNKPEHYEKKGFKPTLVAYVLLTPDNKENPVFDYADSLKEKVWQELETTNEEFVEYAKTLSAMAKF